jgi:hypothetical protein
MIIQKSFWPSEVGLFEYILSPGVLHCGSKGLKWRCQTEKSRGVLPHYVNYSFSGTRLPRYINERVHSHVYASAAQPTAQHSPSQAIIYSGPPKLLPSRGAINIEFWPEVVKDYSSGKLTFTEEKVLAIAGVESEFNKLSQDTCLAGLWKQDIIRQLAWKPTMTTSPPEDVNSFGSCQAPTWLWASMNRAIDFGTVFSTDAAFVNSSVQPLIPTSPFGDVTGRNLKLCGRTDRAQKRNTHTICATQDHHRSQCVTFRYSGMGVEES